MKRISILGTAVLVILMSFSAAAFAVDKSFVTIEGIHTTNHEIVSKEGSYTIITNKTIESVQAGFIDVKLTLQIKGESETTTNPTAAGDTEEATKASTATSTKATKPTTTATKAPATTAGTKATTGSPKTGEESITLLLIALFLAGACAMYFLRKKSEKALFMLVLLVVLSPIALMGYSKPETHSDTKMITTEIFSAQVLESFTFDRIISNSGGPVELFNGGASGFQWEGTDTEDTQTIVYRLAMKDTISDEALNKEIGISGTTSHFKDEKNGYDVFVPFPQNVSVKLNCPIYSLTYYPNGGQGTPAVFEYLAGTKVTLKAASAFGFSYPYHKLYQWNSQADGLGYPYAVGDSFIMDKNMDMHAIWAPSI